jgi:hypothetical protein
MSTVEYILLGLQDNEATIVTSMQFKKMNDRLLKYDGVFPYVILGRFPGSTKVGDILQVVKKLNRKIKN